MQAHYQTDMGKIYHFSPYSVFIVNEQSSLINLIAIIDLIPNSIKALVYIEDTDFSCAISGITPRYLELIDLNGNVYHVQCPLPWISLANNLIPELNNDDRLKGWIAHGEQLKHRSLIYL